MTMRNDYERCADECNTVLRAIENADSPDTDINEKLNNAYDLIEEALSLAEERS